MATSISQQEMFPSASWRYTESQRHKRLVIFGWMSKASTFLRGKSGYTPFNVIRDLNSSMSLNLEASGHPQPVSTRTAAPDQIGEQSSSRDGVENSIEGGSASKAPSSEDDPAHSLFPLPWALRVLSDLATFMDVGALTDVNTSLRIMRGSPSITYTGQDVWSSHEIRVNNGTTIERQPSVIVWQLLRNILARSSFSFHDSECSLPRTFFNEFVSHASIFSDFPRGRASVPMELTLYQATTNLPSPVVPSGRSLEERRIPITKSRSILSIRLLSWGWTSREENGAGPRVDVARAANDRQFLLWQSREGLDVKLSGITLTAKAWDLYTEGWGCLDASWKGHF